MNNTHQELIAEKEAEFNKIFNTENVWQGEDDWTKNVPIGNLEQWLTQTLQDVLPVIERAVAAERLRLLKALPDEMIVHSYMPSENTPARIGWNDYREAAIKALTPTQTK
jgi:hypothetical protein